MNEKGQGILEIGWLQRQDLVSFPLHPSIQLIYCWVCKDACHKYIPDKTEPRRCCKTWFETTMAASCAGEKKKLNLYYVQETYQQWHQGKASNSEDGAAVWLPGRVLLEIQMIKPSTRGIKGDNEEGMGQGHGRGLLITFSWAVNKSTVIGKALHACMPSSDYCCA